MNDERFLDLIFIFEAVPEKQFDVNDWRNECGTMGCMIGHYCFARPDAELKLNGYYNMPSGRVFWSPVCGDKSNSCDCGPNAIAKYFDIPYEHVLSLFIQPASIYNFTKAQALSSLIKYYNEHAKTPLPLHESSEVLETVS